MSEQDKREQAEFEAWWEQEGKHDTDAYIGQGIIKSFCATAWSNGAFKQREHDRAALDHQADADLTHERATGERESAHAEKLFGRLP